MERRDFLRRALLVGAGLGFGVRTAAEGLGENSERPRIISTHAHGRAANRRALEVLSAGGSSLDAVQQGVMVVEADPEVTSVGYGSWPNAAGDVELDAALMDGATRNAGAVAGLRQVVHPVAVARQVMDRTPHVLLVGDGALRFALAQGFRKTNLLTRQMRRRWRAGERPGGEDHDTIGLVAMDAQGRTAAACTTSGLAGKLPGRVGDSPLVGHGLYCDDAAGGATATGVGEEVIKVCGSYRVVEFMREGIDPNEAIRRVLRRILQRDEANRDRMFAFVAMRADAALGYGAMGPGLVAAITVGERTEIREMPALLA